MGDINNTCVDEITCPHCGFEYCDSWEMFDTGEYEICPDCEKEFVFYRNITYTTYKR